ncbi:hypothetical protein GCM10023149_00990 [Mucilaginibacter gynuensis]|uniref:LysM domain-containing protein n=1 Tax=Mucilaginibacter gynuensis TaxID=1302236 RepID=A0ABP8FMV7_9SPHI
MKFKLTLLFISFFALSVPVLATPLLDSVGVENQNGKKVVLHKLDPKDNYYSIGRRYNIKPGVIIKFNNNAPLRIGSIIKVPTDLPFEEQTVTTAPTTTSAPVNTPTKTTPTPVVTEKPAVVQQPVQQQPATNTDANVPVFQDYKVSAGETLYAIARRFNTNVEDITTINKLTSTSLTPGQIIKVRANTPATTVPVTPPATTTQAPANTTNNDRIVAQRDSTTPNIVDSASRGINGNRFGLYEKNEKGVATWMEEAGLDANKKLVLHRTAPIGTVIKIVNPMTNRTTFAKVVGRFTDNESTKDVIIVMTKNVAESLGAIDKRFHVNISYGSPNE